MNIISSITDSCKELKDLIKSYSDEITQEDKTNEDYYSNLNKDLISINLCVDFIVTEGKKIYKNTFSNISIVDSNSVVSIYEKIIEVMKKLEYHIDYLNTFDMNISNIYTHDTTADQKDYINELLKKITHHFHYTLNLFLNGKKDLLDWLITNFDYTNSNLSDLQRAFISNYDIVELYIDIMQTAYTKYNNAIEIDQYVNSAKNKLLNVEIGMRSSNNPKSKYHKFDGHILSLEGICKLMGKKCGSLEELARAKNITIVEEIKFSTETIYYQNTLHLVDYNSGINIDTIENTNIIMRKGDYQPFQFKTVVHNEGKAVVCLIDNFGNGVYKIYRDKDIYFSDSYVNLVNRSQFYNKIAIQEILERMGIDGIEDKKGTEDISDSSLEKKLMYDFNNLIDEKAGDLKSSKDINDFLQSSELKNIVSSHITREYLQVIDDAAGTKKSRELNITFLAELDFIMNKFIRYVSESYTRSKLYSFSEQGVKKKMMDILSNATKLIITNRDTVLLVSHKKNIITSVEESFNNRLKN